MKKYFAPFGVLILAAVIFGCGGNNGGTSGTSGSTAGNTTGTTAGNTTGATAGSTAGTSGGSFTLSGKATVNGGSWYDGSTLPAGTDTFTLYDTLGDATTFKNVLVPLPINEGGATIIRAGSLFVQGTYSGKTAQAIDPVSGVTASVPLNSDGSLAQDIAIAGKIIVPVSKVGALSFSSGLLVDPATVQMTNNTKDVVVTYASTSVNVPSGSGSVNLSGPISFSGGGTANTQLTIGIACSNANSSCSLVFGGTTSAPAKSQTMPGQMVGSQLPFTSAQLLIGLHG
ncbi:MAG TPA: hypothetical protein VGL56_20905 [Fimbriimonadaceae bacterium]